MNLGQRRNVASVMRSRYSRVDSGVSPERCAWLGSGRDKQTHSPACRQHAPDAEGK